MTWETFRGHNPAINRLYRCVQGDHRECWETGLRFLPCDEEPYATAVAKRQAQLDWAAEVARLRERLTLVQQIRPGSVEDARTAAIRQARLTHDLAVAERRAGVARYVAEAAAMLDLADAEHAST